ncbi:hypothetical protein [Mariniluteicoccus flavus]
MTDEQTSVGAPAERTFGVMDFEVPDDFGDPLPDDVVALWE